MENEKVWEWQREKIKLVSKKVIEKREWERKWKEEKVTVSMRERDNKYIHMFEFERGRESERDWESVCWCAFE